MFRPKEMERVVIVGPKGQMEETIEVLHSLSLVHIMDFTEPDETLNIGQPLEKASDIANNLVKLRAISSTLEIEKAPVEKPAEPEPDISQKILTLELNINEEENSRKEVETLLIETNNGIELLKPFAKLGLSFDKFTGYKKRR